MYNVLTVNLYVCPSVQFILALRIYFHMYARLIITP